MPVLSILSLMKRHTATYIYVYIHIIYIYMYLYGLFTGRFVFAQNACNAFSEEFVATKIGAYWL